MPTVVELKAILRRYGVPTPGIKEVLVRRIVDAQAKERSKRMERAIVVKNHPSLRLGAPREGRPAVYQRLIEETEAALRASGHEGRLKRNPALQTSARHRLRRHQIVSLLHNGGKRRLVDQLPRFILRKEAGIVKDYCAEVPFGHPLEVDVQALLHAMSSSAKTLLEE